MTQQNPITPPPELVQQWTREYDRMDPRPNIEPFIATRAAQWGADQELEACCEEMKSIPSPLGIPFGEMASNALRAARRSKLPSLKEQALALVEQHEDGWRPSPKDWDTIRRALEALPDSIVVFPSQC